ncbi:MAG: hypothetical protein KZQ97_10375 [Candidatus Thiodiazotropha sp. (ex Dulcina madagascariensis)]|nr:hypothetical protein [Candidatus Thiodiazotropha sp. (ex Dulcina madagascariensis)]
MSSFNRFKDLEEARKKKNEARERLLRKMRAPRTKPTAQQKRSSEPDPKPELKENTEQVQESSKSTGSTPPPWAGLQSGDAELKLFARSEEKQELQLQPWTHELIDIILEATEEGSINLCLLWPVCFSGIALLHSLVNIERNFANDLRGMRSLLYPGTHTSQIVLQSVLANRVQLSDLLRSLWVNKGGVTRIESYTRSTSFEAMLIALNDIRIMHPEVDNPSLAELVPTFTYDPKQQEWISVSKFPLERSLKKVDKLARRRDIRRKINNEWGDPLNAPGALMVLHRSAKKNDWTKALNNQVLGVDGQPEVFLLDATSAAVQGNHSSVMRIPDFLNVAIKNGYGNTGAVVVADDPKTFFLLRAQLNKLKLNHKTKVWAAEADESILSTQTLPAGWKPKQKSNANFQVGIVDRDASQVALSFQRLAQEAGDEDSPSYQAVIKACLYVLRLSNLPAGYFDLTAEMSETGEDSFESHSTAWTPVLLGIQGVIESGVLNVKRAEAEKAISKAEILIDKWNDATPMAAKLLNEVEKHAVKGRERLSVVLPSKKYIKLAQRFLQRKLGELWITAEERLDWHTLLTVNKILTVDGKTRHFIFIGVNRNVMRLLITHPDIPHGTTILITYKQAESTLTTLNGMMNIEAFKPYRGRMGLLRQQLEQRLKEIPNHLAIGKLREMKMIFNLEADDKSNTTVEQSYYKFELEDGGYACAAGWLYRYEPNEDPFFRRVAASSIHRGDYIFEMSDELRIKLESVLQINSGGLSSVVYPERVLLKLYHDDINSRCDLFFKATKRSAMAKEIHAKMVEIDLSADECRPGRVYYWLDLQADGDTRPHAPKDIKFFKIFCKALQISDEEALNYWNIIRNARNLSQDLGRELSARYAEILFQPESAVVYRNISETVIKQLQQVALRCVYRVEHVVQPQNKGTAV